MTTLYIIILGIVQGLTEFLPVSSSGHLVLLNKIFKIEGNFILLSVVLHVATLFSVCIVLRKQIWELIKHPFSSEAKKLYVATIPTVIIVLIFKKFFESAFSGAFLPICFMITAVLLFITEMLSKNRQQEKPLSYKSAIVMGVVQGAAVLPGISRSGSTIASGLLMGEGKEQTTSFSFLMSIPIILASLALEIYEMVKSGAGLVGFGIFDMLLGFVFAFVVGIFSIKLMYKAVKDKKLIWFSLYLFFISILSFCI